ncbi:MAG: AI-2E family transporter, partial [Candidatus Azambacteria bacterium]|nr:AI-2E family transporter [Candidatus Azambacteria bacterium]
MTVFSRQIIDISFASIMKVAAVVLGLALMYSVKEVIALVFLAIIIASTVDRWASFFERHRIPRMGGVALVYAGFVGFIVVILYFIVPPILEEVKQLVVFLPDYYNVAAKQIFRTTRGISPEYARNMQDFVAGLEARITGFTSGALSTAANVFGGVVSFGVVIVISFYLAMQKRGVENFLRLVTPRAQEEYVLNVWQRVEIKLG